MKHLKLILVFIVLAFISSCEFHKKQHKEDFIYLADPTIFKENDLYYLYGTSSGGLDSVKNGFLVYESKDLKNWQKKGYALKKEDAFGDSGFWAPQVFKRNDLYYMAYTANQSIAIATSKSPLGPFINPKKQPFKSSVNQIDPFVFFDNEKAYMYHVRVDKGNRIFVAELNDDLQSIKEETLTKCITAEKFWEDTKAVKSKIAEGPTVCKIDNLYYLFYSANDFRNPDYAVGYATSNHPLGPWEKAKNNPIIDRNIIDGVGTGHGDVFYDEQQTMYYVLHTHFSNENVRPRKTGIIELTVDKDTKEIKAKPETLRFLYN